MFSGVRIDLSYPQMQLLVSFFHESFNVWMNITELSWMLHVSFCDFL